MAATKRLTWAVATVALLAGIVGIASVWTGIAVLADTSAAWMALVAALDAAILLRLAGAPAGKVRALMAVIATGLTIVLANWFIVAIKFAAGFGLTPMESAFRLGPDLAWTVAAAANGTLDRLWLALSLALAWWAGGGRRRPR